MDRTILHVDCNYYSNIDNRAGISVVADVTFRTNPFPDVDIFY